MRKKKVEETPTANILTSKPRSSFVLCNKSTIDPLAEFYEQEIIERQSKGLISRKSTGLILLLLDRPMKAAEKSVLGILLAIILVLQ